MSKASLKERVFQWFSHPVVGFIGTVTGVIGIGLGLWTYFQQVPSRAMVAVEPSIRSVLVNRDVPAALQVQVNGKAVTSQDVFAVQLAVWNKGNQSIRSEHVLEPLVLKPLAGTRIVDAKVIRETRPVCASTITVNADETKATLAWRIYEPDDGVIVQLLLVGNADTPIGLGGIVEGGGRLRYIRLEDAASGKAAPRFSARKTLWEWLVVVALIFLFVGGGGMYVIDDVPQNWRARREPRGYRKLAESLFVGVGGVAFGLVLIWAVVVDGIRSESVPSSLLEQPAASTER